MADVAVFYIDLDHFKSVNDTFGHAAGDEVLQSVAWRPRGMLPERATIGRLGGDEFAITLAGMSSTEMAELTTRLNDRLAAAYRVHGEQVQVRASIGARLATAGDPPADAPRRADLRTRALAGLAHHPERRTVRPSQVRE